MRLEQSFEVPVPVGQAWDVLLDLERVAPCMPGATLTSFDGTAFTGTVKVKLGPISLAYRGTGRITERDEPGRRISFVAQGQDSRGAGGASARVSAVLHSTPGGNGTLVRVVTDLDISGKAAQFGRGMIADVSGKVIKQFADNLAAVIGSAAPSPAPAPVPIPTQPGAVDAVPPASPPPLAPLFSEPATPPPPPAPVAPVFPPPPAGWEPPGGAAGPAAQASDAAPPAQPDPTPAAEADYVPPTPAYSGPPEYHPLALQEPAADEPAPAAPPAAAPPAAPAPAPAAVPAPAPVPGTGLRQPPVEAEPLDLLAISGAKGVLRKAAPVLVIVALALVGLVVWLVAFR
jgi:carbon monoxide dehydrogenase subunit G